MTLRCLDCGSDRFEDLSDDWENAVAACPHCRAPLFDDLGKQLDHDAVVGWCHNPHRHSSMPTTQYGRDHWDWRDRDLFDHSELLPRGERAEMAANAEPAEPDLEERR